MSRSGLKFVAVLLSTLIVLVLVAGLDNLPRGVRAQVDAERSALAAAQKQVQAAKDDVAGDLRTEAELFRTVPASQQWPGGLGQADAQLAAAARGMDELTKLEKQNRRQDRERVESLLSTERNARSAAVTQATGIQKEAAHWVEMKRQLPAQLQQMDADYKSIHGFDMGPVRAAVQKAETDWPEKKVDLDSRLAALAGAVSASDSVWQSSAEERREAAAGDLSKLDFGALFTAAGSLHTTAADLPARSAEIQALSGQLYNSWDKILVDMEERGRGNNRSWDQKIRTVKTQLTDASAKTGTTTSDEKWVDVSQSTYVAMRGNLGMAIEHKPAGKYDVEAERVAQPAGFAYMAPPGQSNQYGYWERHDGRDFWVFYGQYALLRDLLFNRGYRPIDRYDWDGYYTSRRSGQTYYGRDEAAGTPKYGTQGSTTQDRYSGSSYARSGGFRDSQYASKSGSYRSSPYASPGARDPGGDHEAKRFGKSAGEPRVSPPPSRSFHPAPRSAPRPSFRPSAPRRFGRR